MKTKSYIIKFFAFLVLFSLFAYANTKSESLVVANAIAARLTGDDVVANRGVEVNFQNVRKELYGLKVDRDFTLKSVSISSAAKDGSGLDISGFILFGDHMGRSIRVKFDTFCLVKNRRNFDVKNLKMSYLARPRTLFFIVPSKSLSVRRLKKMTFIQALRSVKSVARRLKGYDEFPQKYTMLAFLLDRIGKESRVYGVISDDSFSPVGKLGVTIRTRDKWRIVVSRPDIFAYNNDTARYFNLFWKDNGYLMALSSYSTQGLIKSIQIALEDLGYDVGEIDGKLNPKTKKMIKRYLKESKFYDKSRIDDDLLWFMQQEVQIDVQKTVQLALSQIGINIGRIDGEIGSVTIRGLKKFQRKMGLRADGKITPKLVRLLVRVSKIVDVNSSMKRFLGKAIFVRKHQDKMWYKEFR